MMLYKLILLKKMKLVVITLLLAWSIDAIGQTNSNEMQSQRFMLGWEKLKEVEGEAGEKVINSLTDISPDLGKFIIEYAFGDIYARETLDMKSKEIAVGAALIAMGNAEPQLKVHINGALNTGSTINEIKEVILQMSVYSGIPNSINGINALKDVLSERQKKGIYDDVGKSETQNTTSDRLLLGEKELSALDSTQVEKLKNAYDDFSPELVRDTPSFPMLLIFFLETI